MTNGDTSGHVSWGYIRVSGDEQADRGLPVAGQRRALEEYAREHNLILERVFVDEARSGGSDQREQFQLMMHLAHQDPPPCTQILLWSWSRFARDQDDAHYWKASLRRHGIQLRAIDGETPDAPTGFDYVLEALIHWKDEQKLIEVSQSARRGQQTLAKMGYVPSGARPPRGYRVLFEEKTIEGRKRKLRRWVPDPETWPLVRQAWEMRMRGDSYSKIQRATGLYKSAGCYSTFFGNTTYKGELEFGDTVIPVEPVVTEEEWAMVNDKRQERQAGSYPRTQSSAYLLSGLLTCARCGRAICGYRSNPGVRNDGYYRQEWVGYRCLGVRDGECDLPQIKAESIETAVINEILDHVLTPQTLQRHVKRMAAIESKLRPAWEARASALTRRLEETNKAIEHLLDVIEAGQASQSIGARLADREREGEELARELASLQKQMEAQPESQPNLLATRERLRTMLMEGDRPEARRLISQYVFGIEVDADSAIMRYVIPTSTGIREVPPTGGLCVYMSRQLSSGRRYTRRRLPSPHNTTSVSSVP